MCKASHIVQPGKGTPWHASHCLQEVTPRLEALEAALHGVDNLAGRAVALDAMADELGLDVPTLNIPAATAETAGETPDGAVRAAAGAARKVLEIGKQPRALKGLSMAMTDIKTDNDNLRRYGYLIRPPN